MLTLSLTSLVFHLHLNLFTAINRKTRIPFSPLEHTKLLFWEFDHLRFEIGDLVTSLLEGGLIAEPARQQSSIAKEIW